MDHHGGGAGHAPARPVLFTVARARGGGRFTYLTPHWPDARGWLVGLLNQHAAAATTAAALDVARLARAAAHQVPAVPPTGAWTVQVGQCRYQLDHKDLGPAPDAGPHQAAGKAVRAELTDKEPHR
jgi:hypothetical protein